MPFGRGLGGLVSTMAETPPDTGEYVAFGLVLLISPVLCGHSS